MYFGEWPQGIAGMAEGVRSDKVGSVDVHQPSRHLPPAGRISMIISMAVSVI